MWNIITFLHRTDLLNWVDIFQTNFLIWFHTTKPHILILYIIIYFTAAGLPMLIFFSFLILSWTDCKRFFHASLPNTFKQWKINWASDKQKEKALPLLLFKFAKITVLSWFSLFAEFIRNAGFISNRNNLLCVNRRKCAHNIKSFVKSS